MAFLSSFRIGQQTVYPEALYERLKSFALLENVATRPYAPFWRKPIGSRFPAAPCWNAMARTMRPCSWW